MDKIIIAPKARGESLRWTGTLSESVATATEIWFTVKSSAGDADASAVHLMTKTGGGVTVSTTQVTASITNFGGTLPNRAASLACELRVRLADGFEGVVAQGVIQMKPAIYRGS